MRRKIGVVGCRNLVNGARLKRDGDASRMHVQIVYLPPWMSGTNGKAPHSKRGESGYPAWGFKSLLILSMADSQVVTTALWKGVTR